LLPTLRELGIALVAWSPLGRGFLTGTVTKLEKNDFRQHNPRYSGDNLNSSLDRFAPFMNLAKDLGVSPAQLAQGQDIFPIPGTRKADRIAENAKAASLLLDARTLRRLSKLARPGLAEGATLV
jgi:aryl-alcohol dehydrogenase-like predicted oxidoreductase